MKLQKLTIHNIASIEDATIDFGSEPLSSSEVFLIAGKTGAGKSTILDAICLALFANTPRMYNTLMQGNTQDAKLNVAINDPRQLMRRNTGEAFARLTFTGSNDIRYEAEWSVARARKKATGNPQSKAWSLTNFETGNVLTKDKEIRAEVHTAIGLDFNQFCRTTMLAQGEFTRFLNSKDDEKAAILEKITGVDIYSKIGKKVYDITAEKNVAWEEAKRRSEGIHLLTEEERNGMKKLLDELKLQIDKLNEDKGKEDKKRKWLTDFAALNAEESKLAAECDKAEAIVNAEEFKEKDSIVKQWNETIAVRGRLKDSDSAAQEKTCQQENLAVLCDSFAELQAGQCWVAQEKDKAKAEQKRLNEDLASEKERVPAYEMAQTIGGHLSTVINGEKRISAEQQVADKETLRLDGVLKETKSKAEKECTEAKTAFEKQETLLKQHEKALEEAHLPELRKQKENVLNTLHNLETAKDRIGNLIAERERANKNRSALEMAKIETERLTVCLKDLEPKIHDAELRYETCSKLFERQKDTVDKWAKGMRSKLHLGEMCPVCGQEIKSAVPHEDELESLFADAEKARNDAKKEKENLEAERNRLAADVALRTEQYNKDKKKLEENRTLSRRETEAAEACNACGMAAIEDATSEVLKDKEEAAASLQKETEDKISIAEGLEKVATESRRTTDRLRQAFNDSKDEVNTAGQKIVECKGNIQSANNLVQTKKDEIQQAQEQIAALLTGSWNSDWRTSPADFKKELDQAATVYNKKQRELDVVNERVRKLSDEASNVDSPMAAVLELMPSLQGKADLRCIHVEQLLNKVNDAHTRIQRAKDMMAVAEKNEKDAKADVEAYVAEHPEINEARLRGLDVYSQTDVSNKNAELTHARNEVLTKQTLLKNSRQRQKEQYDRKPELSDDETIDVLTARISTCDGEITRIGEQRGGINQQLRQDEENKRTVSEFVAEAKKKECDYSKWSRLNQLIGDATGNKFRKIALGYVLGSLIYSANGYMGMLTDRYTLKVSPGDFVISVEDAYQGYVSRATTTISGGESFLVSLSLALALSDIGTRLSVDTLFIDEGFGTLSGEPLQKAIETLRTLHTKNRRHVGIISHVEELQEKIPVQIQVLQEGNNSSSTVRIIP